MTRELDHLLDEVRMSMEYDVYSRLHNEIIEMETDFEETLILKEKIKELQATIEALKDERNNMTKTHRNTIRKLELDIRTLEAMDYVNKVELKELQSTIEAQEIIIKDKSSIMEAMAQPKTCSSCDCSIQHENKLFCHKKFSPIYGQKVGYDFCCNGWVKP